MSIKIKPVGNKILVKPRTEDEHQTTGGIVAVNLNLSEGEVVEVSGFLSNIYKPGDIVIFPKEAGNSHMYNGEPHIFLNGTEMPQGDIWAIVTND